MEEPLKREETLKRVVDELSRRGYAEHFKAIDGGLQALVSGERFGSKDLTIRGSGEHRQEKPPRGHRGRRGDRRSETAGPSLSALT